MGTATAVRADALAERLRMVLESAACRRIWERHVRQRPDGGISQAAVARAIADHLVDIGERRWDETDLHRHLKDRVSRALGGGGVSVTTLQWFIDAFDVAEGQAEELRALMSSAPGPGGEYRNLSIHELHCIGPDRRLASHRTVQVIQAGASPMSHYLYRVDTPHAEVTVLRGGRTGPLRPLGDGLFGVEIELTRPLEPGQTASLEYTTLLRYQQQPPSHVRRWACRRLDSLEMRVQFHPGRLPARLRWARWPHLHAPARNVEEVRLDPEHSAHRFVTALESDIVGFAWEW